MITRIVLAPNARTCASVCCGSISAPASWTSWMTAICEWFALADAGNQAPPITASAAPSAATLKPRSQRLVTQSLRIV
jgi:hypothetical protein